GLYVTDRDGVLLCSEACERVTRFVPRRIVTASDQGVWLLGDELVGLSARGEVPLGPAPIALSDVGLGDFSGLWWARVDGLARGRPGAEHSEDPRAVRDMAFSLSRALVLRDSTVFERDPGGNESPVPIPSLDRLLATRAAVYLFGASRVARRGPEGWEVFPLPVEPEAIAASPRSDTVWLSSGDRLFRLHGPQWTRYSLPARLRAMAVDSTETLWAITDQALLRLAPDRQLPTPTFSDDIEPWLAPRCTSCHRGFSDPVYFQDIAENALARVRTGDMPRSGAPVPAADYALLYDWLRLGRLLVPETGRSP
ncbi:MAG: hypothetical protein AAFX94_10155, partial [Myxococcota bacterium]